MSNHTHAAGDRTPGHQPARPEDQFACYAETGCSECFRKVYDLAEPLIRSRVANALNDADDVDDLTSDIFARILRARAKYDRRLPLLHWLNRITTNAIRNSLRDRGRNRMIPFSRLEDHDETEIPSQQATPERAAERNDIAARVTEVLSVLPPSFQVAFEMHHGAGMTYRQAGDRLGVRPGTVKTRAYRSCRHLEVHMGSTLRDALADEIYSPR